MRKFEAGFPVIHNEFGLGVIENIIDETTGGVEFDCHPEYGIVTCDVRNLRKPTPADPITIIEEWKIYEKTSQ